MTVNSANDLEKALLERARRLADEYLAHARQRRERMIQEENERLRIREEREAMSVEEEAERLYRRRVQASELLLKGEAESLRWELIQEVKGDLVTRLQELAQWDDDYLPLLSRLLAEAARAMPGVALTARFNARDLERVRSRWPALCAEAAPGRELHLEEGPVEIEGGVVVSSRDGRMRVDNSFAGRMERLGSELEVAIAENLFAERLLGGGRHV